MMAWANVAQTVDAIEPEATPQITVYVYNWAQVESETLRKAKEVASHVFWSAGVEAAVLDPPPASEDEKGNAVGQFLAHLTFFVHLYTPAMAKRFRFPSTMLGLAPGTPEDQDRTTVYVFDHVAARMAQEQAMARVSNIVSFSADKGQILGHGIAHEIGHVLLYQASHSRTGLMRATWDRHDLQTMVLGELGFTPGEGKQVRAEILRRNAERRALEIGP